ncbi:MAG: hypothetical protein NVSMB43_09950 [Pseudarthrobacter sp.]
MAFPEQQSDTKVAELCSVSALAAGAFDEQDIRRFNVPVHDAVVMDVRQAISQIMPDIRHPRRRHRAGSTPAPEVRAPNEFHHQVAARILRVTQICPGVEQGHKRRVAHTRQDAHLRFLPTDLLQVTLVPTKHLHRNVPAKQLINGTVDA